MQPVTMQQKMKQGVNVENKRQHVKKGERQIQKGKHVQKRKEGDDGK